MISITTLVHWVLGLLICGAIIGLLCLAVDKFPWVPGEYKQGVKAVIFIGAIFMLVFALLGLLNGGPVFVR